MRVASVFSLVVVVCWSTAASMKPLTVVLRSSWDYTPLLLETSEFLWEHEKTLFWKFVNHTTVLFPGGTEKDAYEFAVDGVEQFLPASSHNIFLLALSLRAHSPAVQMFYQVSEEAYKMSASRLGSRLKDCASSPLFVEVNGRLACSMDDMLDLITENAEPNGEPQEYVFDHKFPVWPSGGPLVVLYAELGTPDCATFHSELERLAQQGQIRYIFRHYVKERPSRPLYLSGYGVKLSVKNTEYKAVDDTKVNGEAVHVVLSEEEEEKEVSGFRMATLTSRHPKLKSQLTDFNQHLLQGAREMPELKLWQLQDLGFQAAQKIVLAGTDFGLKVAKDIAQNLPTQAKQLYKVQVTSSLRKEVLSNQNVLSGIGVGPGQCVVLLNGIVLRNDEIDIFQLLEVLLSESRLLDDLVRLDVHSSWHLPLLELPMHGGTQTRSVVVDVRSEHVIFINNLEKDVQYRGWPKSLKEFMRPTFPGMLRQIGRNVFHIVFMLDPVSSDGAELLEYMQLFLDHNVPAQLGVLLVPQADSEVGVAVCQAFAYTVHALSPRQAFHWLVQAQNMSTSSADVNVAAIRGLYDRLFSGKLSGTSLDDVFDVLTNTYCRDARQFYQTKGFGSLPQVLVNGVQLDLEQEELEAAIVTRMHQQTYEMQQAIFNNKLKDSDDVYGFFLDRPSVLQRVNKYILTTTRLLDLSRADSQDVTAQCSEEQIAGALTANVRYMCLPEGEFTVKRLTVWLVIDLTTIQGRQLLQDALTYTLTTEHVQVGVVHAEDSLLAHSVAAAGRMQWSMSSVTDVVQHLLQLAATQDVDMDGVVGVAEKFGLQGQKFKMRIQSSQVNATVNEHIIFCNSVLKIERGQNALISNGKIMGPFSEGEEFSGDDWTMLYDKETEQYADDLVGVVENLQVSGVSPDDDTPSFRSELLMKIASLLRSAPKRQRLSMMPELANKHSGLHLSARDPDQALTMIAILDPLSPDTQHLAPVLQTLHAALSLDLSIYFNPVEKLSELPVTTFYRYLLEPELSFNEDGSLREDAVVAFSALPTSPLLTLSLDVPHSWLVEPVFSPYDLDNIHLGAVTDGGVHAVFTLEHILVEGQCFDADMDQPTPGLEFVLGSVGRPELFDTIIMANLGYFQLKAGPGAWVLRMRPGRSEDIYAVHSYSGKGGRMVETEDSEVSIDVRGFRGAAVVVKVKKRPGMEKVNLVAADGQSQTPETEGGGGGGGGGPSNIWNTLSSFLQSGGDSEAPEGGPAPSTTVNETINIFSIASGHLYERFLRIMMLSVIKHTKNPVKFWFLKNYLSPTFKNFIPYMAARYGFEVELVEYKWPRWLRAQKEKQRLIWGYKILFLDVLFPLHVKKIIFVDADQIVRVDMKELLDEPLDGAPYAYTPFCDSRPDMKGFRFWDQGYWKNHLGNRRYHISALYLVDLVTFRQMAAGDRLRGQYQALSQDPNSLSNLDQDLPNNMIHSVPIKSLPQDWLWCETWCSQETKPRAKTIDLCNNPMTKEPKLDSAMRIVPEWTDYDMEIKALWEEFRKTSSSTRKEDDGEATRTVAQDHVHGEL